MAKKKEVSFMDILNNEESYSLLESIEELSYEEEEDLVEMRKRLIKRMKDKYGYTYKS